MCPNIRQTMTHQKSWQALSRKALDGKYFRLCKLRGKNQTSDYTRTQETRETTDIHNFFLTKFK